MTATEFTPTITEITPDSGTEQGGTSVTINGTGFTGALGVYFGYGQNTANTLVSAVFTVVSDTQITCTSPVSPLPNGIGEVNVVVMGAAVSPGVGGQSGTPSLITEVSRFRYTYGGTGFSTSTVSHKFLNADGSGETGYLVFSLSERIINGASSYGATRFEVNLEVLTAALISAVSATSITITGGNNTFSYTPFGGSVETFTIAGGTYSTLATIAAALNAATGSISSEAFSTKVTVTVSGANLVFTANTGGTAHNGDTVADHGGSTPITTLFSTATLTLAGGMDAGHFSQSLVSNVDTDSRPAWPWHTRWRVDLHLDNAPRETYWFVVPAGGGSWDLYDLLPTIQQVR